MIILTETFIEELDLDFVAETLEEVLFSVQNIKHLGPGNHPSRSEQDVDYIKSTWRPWSIFEDTFIGKILEALLAQFQFFVSELQNGNDIDWQEAERIWQQHLAPSIVEIAKKAVEDTVKQISLTISYEMTTLSAAEWALLYSAQQVKDIDNVTRKALQQTIADWIANGKDGGVASLVKLIQGTKDGSGVELFSRERAERIARSELTTIYAQAKAKALEANGYRKAVFLPRAHVNCRCYVQPGTAPDGTKVIVWYTVRDEMVCEREIETPFGTVNGCKNLHRVILSEGYAGQKFEKNEWNPEKEK